MRRNWGAIVGLAAVLAGCGGGGGSGSAGPTASTPAATPAPTPTPTPTSVAGCSLRERQDWAAAQLREWYLFPETLPGALDPTPYRNVGDYVDALTATARGQRRDRYFTYVTSIREEEAYYTSGQSAGFGIRLSLDQTGQRLFITEAFENAPALNAGVDRGAEILAIGTTSANLRTVSAIVTAEGSTGLTNALGPDTAGTTRVLRISDAAGTRTVTLAKTDFALTPVSSRYGTKVISDGGRQVGYINLRTFIDPAEAPLRAAFAQFRAAGITNIIVDLRYNGGGLVSVAELVGDLMGANRSTSEVFSYTSFRAEKAAENDTKLFAPQPQSVAPTRVAFIGTGGTASASELVINAFIPYLHANAGLIGGNTYGKPVGQIALDKPACDDRLRVIAFATQNAARAGDYYDGLATKVEASCRASDDIGYPLGDPREASTRAALDFIAGRSCTRIGATATSAANRAASIDRTVPLGATEGPRELLMPERPTTPQREVPGLF
ncbi:peptidase S41 [Sphingomonas ginsenosidivorax]|uniref:Peptidase S41 n=1 Tax=Sphingomonas ginsenosidivorax TaxID=862135 RepID=A0A5C6UJY9_9SPHN|nr:S41 family peptidase [Sphingomonas ginsenosidivorax]TXC72536.1 peptidase S41 [Sphingomonas ginsenosidivorax]